MATFTDFLITVFSTQGVGTYQQQLRNASQAVLGLAAANAGLGRNTYAVFFAFYHASPAIQFFAAQALTAIGVIRSLNLAFTDAERTIFQLQVTMAHAGYGELTGKLIAYAKARQMATGIDEMATLSLAEQLVNLRFAGNQIDRLVPAIQNAAAAGHGTSGGGGAVNQEAAASNIARAIAMGETSALINLGLDVGKIRRSADQANEIIRQMTTKFAGNAELAMATSFQQQSALANNWKSLMREAGDALGPLMRLVVIIANHFVFAFRFIVLFVRESFRFITFGLYRPQTERNQEAVDAAARGWDKGDSRTLRKIEENTRDIQTTLARQTLGAAGAAVRNAATIRNFRTAVSVRG